MLMQIAGERDYWDRRVDEIDGFWHPLDESEARANLTALVILVAGCETALDLLERIVHSQEFKDASNFLDELDNELTELGNDLADNYEKAKNAVKGFAEDLDRTIVDLNHEWKTTVNEVQGFVDNASLELTNFVNEQKAALDNLTCDLQNLLNGVKAQLVKTAQEEVEKIKNDDTLLVAANKGLDSFDSLQQSAFDSLNNIMKDVVGNLVDIQHISLDGTITADAKKQTPFVITIRGKFGGKRDFEFKLEWVPWRPGADDMALFKRLSTMLMSYLNGEDVGLSKEPPKTISQEQVTRNGDMKVDTQDPVDEDEYGIDSLMQEPVKTDELNGWLAERVDVGED
ncbi:MAG: hypothetical protein L6R41_002637 [Letrouitia leprolyta]|nr:MAG: hypothetical protein L6R41_002637 [Letrouitia leprolyta]